jgi:hypothetical protein
LVEIILAASATVNKFQIFLHRFPMFTELTAGPRSNWKQLLLTKMYLLSTAIGEL